MNTCDRCGQDIPSDVDQCVNLTCRKLNKSAQHLDLLGNVYEAAKLYHAAFYFGNGRNQSTARKGLLEAVDNANRWLEDLKD